MNKQINISVKDLKHGDYVYNIDDTSKGQFHYVSIFDKSDEAEIFEEIISMLHCFAMKMYSKRRKRKLEIVQENLKNEISL